MAIKLYWCRGKGHDDPCQRNFGDYLSPLLVQMLASKPVVFAPVHRADMMAIGSIMNREKKARSFLFPHRLHIWGTGTDAENRTFSSRHHYHAVRGRYTMQQIQNLTGTPALGDPGLLASYWWEGRPKPKKKYAIGLIPHYYDQSNPLIKQIATHLDAYIIDVFWPVEDVLNAIQSCDFVLSSSMHGLIVADAFSVPNRHLLLSEGVISSFKFLDYYSAFGLEKPAALLPEQLLQCQTDPSELVGDWIRPGLAKLQEGLALAFPPL